MYIHSLPSTNFLQRVAIGDPHARFLPAKINDGCTCGRVREHDFRCDASERDHYVDRFLLTSIRLIKFYVPLYRGEIKGMYILLSRTQARPGRAGKQEQEENSRNYVKAFK